MKSFTTFSLSLLFLFQTLSAQTALNENWENIFTFHSTSQQVYMNDKPLKRTKSGSFNFNFLKLTTSSDSLSCNSTFLDTLSDGIYNIEWNSSGQNLLLNRNVIQIFYDHIIFDDEGNYYITKTYTKGLTSIDVDLGQGQQLINVNSNKNHLVISKYSKAGVLLNYTVDKYDTKLTIVKLFLDSDNNLYVFGVFRGEFHFGASNPNMNIINYLKSDYTGPGTKTDAFLAKYNHNTQAEWARRIDKSSSNSTSFKIENLTEDKDGNLYFNGTCRGTVTFFPKDYSTPITTYPADWKSSTINVFSSSYDDAFLIKLSPNGILRLAKQLSSNEDDYISAVGIDSLYNIYMGVYYRGDNVSFDNYGLMSDNSRCIEVMDSMGNKIYRNYIDMIIQAFFFEGSDRYYCGSMWYSTIYSYSHDGVSYDTYAGKPNANYYIVKYDKNNIRKMIYNLDSDLINSSIFKKGNKFFLNGFFSIPSTLGFYALELEEGNATPVIDYASKASFSVYPNPSRNNLFLELGNSSPFYKYSISNNVGQEVANGLIPENREISTSLHSGYYFLHLYGSSGETASRMFSILK